MKYPSFFVHRVFEESVFWYNISNMILIPDYSSLSEDTNPEWSL
jgi:hypothetical protein